MNNFNPYLSSGFNNDAASKEEIANYKESWRIHGFPDVDRAQQIRHQGLINDPISQPTPEQHLWQQVLVEAMQDVKQGKGLDVSEKHKQYAKEAEAWFASTSKDECSFEWVCHMLNLDPSYFRRMLAEGRQRLHGRRYTSIAKRYGRERVRKPRVYDKPEAA